MANTDDLVRFLKVDMVKTGTLIHFCDAGAITDKEFKQDGSTKKSKVLEMEVMIDDTMKKITYTPNKITIDFLKAAWGKDTQTWVGETGIVTIAEQIVFDKLKPVIIIKPLTNLDKAAKIQAQLDRAAQIRTVQPSYPPAPVTNVGTFQAANPGNITDPKDIAWEE